MAVGKYNVKFSGYLATKIPVFIGNGLAQCLILGVCREGQFKKYC